MGYTLHVYITLKLNAIENEDTVRVFVQKHEKRTTTSDKRNERDTEAITFLQNHPLL